MNKVKHTTKSKKVQKHYNIRQLSELTYGIHLHRVDSPQIIQINEYTQKNVGLRLYSNDKFHLCVSGLSKSRSKHAIDISTYCESRSISVRHDRVNFPGNKRIIEHLGRGVSFTSDSANCSMIIRDTIDIHNYDIAYEMSNNRILHSFSIFCTSNYHHIINYALSTAADFVKHSSTIEQDILNLLTHLVVISNELKDPVYELCSNYIQVIKKIFDTSSQLILLAATDNE